MSVTETCIPRERQRGYQRGRHMGVNGGINAGVSEKSRGRHVDITRASYERHAGVTWDGARPISPFFHFRLRASRRVIT